MAKNDFEMNSDNYSYSEARDEAERVQIILKDLERLGVRLGSFKDYSEKIHPSLKNPLYYFAETLAERGGKVHASAIVQTGQEQFYKQVEQEVTKEKVEEIQQQFNGDLQIFMETSSQPFTIQKIIYKGIEINNPLAYLANQEKRIDAEPAFSQEERDRASREAQKLQAFMPEEVNRCLEEFAEWLLDTIPGRRLETFYRAKLIPPDQYWAVKQAGKEGKYIHYEIIDLGVLPEDESKRPAGYQKPEYRPTDYSAVNIWASIDMKIAEQLSLERARRLLEKMEEVVKEEKRKPN